MKMFRTVDRRCSAASAIDGCISAAIGIRESCCLERLDVGVFVHPKVENSTQHILDNYGVGELVSMMTGMRNVVQTLDAPTACASYSYQVLPRAKAWTVAFLAKQGRGTSYMLPDVVSASGIMSTRTIGSSQECSAE